MKPFFISILLFLLLGSCENRVEEKQYFASEEPPATPLPDKAPPIPYVDILKLNYEDYINRYEDKYHPKSEVTFIMNDLFDGIISEFRVGLYNCFSQKESKENDILCASLSILSMNTPNSIEKICSIDSKDLNLEVRDGYLKMMIDIEKFDETKIRDIQTIIKTFEVGIISLKEVYNKYIEIYYKEV